MVYYLINFSTASRVVFYIPFPSSFICRETGQTSESIVGAALIPKSPSNFASLYMLTCKNRHCLKVPVVPACVCVHTRIWQQLLVYVPALSVFTSLSSSCKLHYWKNNLVIMQDSYLDEKWQIPFEERADQMLKENCSFCSHIKPEYWGQAGHNLSSVSQSLSISPFIGPTQKHLSMIVGINAPQ